MLRRALGVVLCGLGAAALLAQTGAVSQEPPRLTNARLETRAVTGNLEGTLRGIVAAQAGAVWIGYAVATNSAERRMCCWNSWDKHRNCCGPCRMESESGFSISSDDTVSTKLEGPNRFFVLVRAENRKVGKILAFSEDCELDAGGLPFIWLTGGRSAESLALLASYASSAAQEEEKKLMDHAVAAVALHADPAADRVLEGFVAPNQPERLRKQAAFWMGAERGRRGYEVLRRLVHDDPSDKVREQAIFALSISKEPAAVDTMIEVARRDPSAHVRGQALFWLGQKAGKKAVGAISEAVENDPDTQVKKKAVFALSQLPKDEGVPLLIQLARTHKNPVVRKQAIFWLGQSKDQRALAFFEEVLKP
jgi:hypothetical protein